MPEAEYILYAPGQAYRQESFASRCIYELAMACAGNIFEEDAAENMSKSNAAKYGESGNICFSHGRNMPK